MKLAFTCLALLALMWIGYPIAANWATGVYEANLTAAEAAYEDQSASPVPIAPTAVSVTTLSVTPATTPTTTPAKSAESNPLLNYLAWAVVVLLVILVVVNLLQGGSPGRPDW